jgi:hypothetical protein
MKTAGRAFTAQAQLATAGNAKGYIVRRALLAAAGVDPEDTFRILVSERRIAFAYLKPGNQEVVVPRPLSVCLGRRPTGRVPAATDEIWPDDGPPGNERFA